MQPHTSGGTSASALVLGAGTAQSATFRGLAVADFTLRLGVACGVDVCG